MPAIALPAPVMAFAIEPKTKGDEDKVFTALRRLQEEDPTIDLHRDEQTGEQIVAGLSQVHVEVVIARLRERFGAEVELHPPRVPYQETIRASARAHGRHKKQSGGRGQFGDCHIEIEPLPAGRGLRVRQRDQRRRDPRRLHSGGRERRDGGDAAAAPSRAIRSRTCACGSTTAPTTRSTPPRWRSRLAGVARDARGAGGRQPGAAGADHAGHGRRARGRRRRRDRRPQQPPRPAARDGTGRRDDRGARRGADGGDAQLRARPALDHRRPGRVHDGAGALRGGARRTSSRRSWRSVDGRSGGGQRDRPCGRRAGRAARLDGPHDDEGHPHLERPGHVRRLRPHAAARRARRDLPRRRQPPPGVRAVHRRAPCTRAGCARASRSNARPAASTGERRALAARPPAARRWRASRRGRAGARPPAPPDGSGNGAARNGWHDRRRRARAGAAGARAAAGARRADERSSSARVSAIERFNRSEHPRTVAGVARSLGAPVVVVRPSEEQGALMGVVVSWELCWYRYEVDLSDDGAAVRLAGQGYELSEIPVEDRVEANAAADEYGTLDAGLTSYAWPADEGRPLIYCVVPAALADELYDKLAAYYADDPNVTVIVDRRKGERAHGRGDDGGGKRRAARPPPAAAGKSSTRRPARDAPRHDEGRRPRRRRGARESRPRGDRRRRLRLPTARCWSSSASRSARRRTTSPSTARCCAGSSARSALGAERGRGRRRLRARRQAGQRPVQGQARGPQTAARRGAACAERLRALARPHGSARAERGGRRARERGARRRLR